MQELRGTERLWATTQTLGTAVSQEGTISAWRMFKSLGVRMIARCPIGGEFIQVRMRRTGFKLVKCSLIHTKLTAPQRTRSPQHDDHHRQQDSGVDSRHQELPSTTTKERQPSLRREYEGGKAVPTTTPCNGFIPNGMGPASVTGKSQNSDIRAPPRGPKADTAPSITSTARVFPYQQPSLATPVARNQRPIPQSLTFNRNAFNNKPYARSATTGSNTEPLTARRGFETPPASAPPVAVQPQNHGLKDTLAPPLQDKDYIISQYPELKNLVKPVWIENPKAPVANFLTGGKGGANGLGPRGPAYRISIGRLGGKPVTRYVNSSTDSSHSLTKEPIHLVQSQVAHSRTSLHNRNR
jgi:hypothetical protein